MALERGFFGGEVQQHFTVCVTVYKKEQHCQSVDIGPVHGPDFPGKVFILSKQWSAPFQCRQPCFHAAAVQPSWSCAPAAAEKENCRLKSPGLPSWSWRSLPANGLGSGRSGARSCWGSICLRNRSKRSRE